tara:strand:+ start:8577 stop:9062 length:486 start_codon:yes stop_codon:yes gene_type:complete
MQKIGVDVMIDLWALTIFWVIAACTILAVVTIPFHKWRKRPLVLITLFCISAFSFLSSFLLEYLIKDEVATLIDEYSFVIESYKGVDNTMLLSALKNKQYIGTHKTHPLKRRKIQITTSSTKLKLHIAQDSKYPNIYWVYYLKYKFSQGNELGKVLIKRYE